VTGSLVPALPWRTRATMLCRLLAIQGAWNYETMLGNGIGFCVEPALRLLPGGVDGPAYREALGREVRYFNAHPYLASIAVGALARVELDREPAERIERFRTALCGPLGSVGDRLVWAGWLPLCSLVALAAFGLGARPMVVVVLFLGLYNAGHLMLRAWGMSTGWTRGIGVAAALGQPVLRNAPGAIARGAAFAAGLGVPLAFARMLGSGGPLLGGIVIAALVGAVLVVRLQRRIEGWRFALVVLSALLLFSVAR
jgi:mannose PTS system EIID component